LILSKSPKEIEKKEKHTHIYDYLLVLFISITKLEISISVFKVNFFLNTAHSNDKIKELITINKNCFNTMDKLNFNKSIFYF